MKAFRGFRVFVFRDTGKNKNAELAENSQNIPFRNLDFINVNFYLGKLSSYCQFLVSKKNSNEM